MSSVSVNRADTGHDVLPADWPAATAPSRPLLLPPEVGAWIARAAAGQPQAEMALLGAMAGTIAALFCGRPQIALCLSSGQEAPGGLRVELDTNPLHSFASVAAAALDTLTAPIPAEGVAATELAVCLRRDAPAFAAWPLVFGFERDERGWSMQASGARAAALSDWVARLWDALVHLALQFAADPHRPLGELDLLPPSQRAALLDVNATANDYAGDGNLAAAALARAGQRTSEIAVHGIERDLSWGELADQAGRFAAWLIAQGVEPGQVVAVVTERHEATVAAFLGIALAGAVYLPVSSEYPAERIAMLVADSGARLAIAIDPAPPLAVPVTAWADIPFALHAPVPPVPRRGDDPLYVIYTSGSTGAPKGVTVSHRNVARLVGRTSYIEWRPSDRIALAATPIFDAVTFEIWGALVNGLPLVCIPKAVFLAPELLAHTLEQKRVTLAFVSTALFNFVAARKPAAFGALRCLLFGGETCSLGLVRAVREANPALSLHHVYGPTENTTFSTCHVVRTLGQRLPIGRPIANSTAWVVDPLLRPLPIGARGQLLLGGDGVAAGYLNAPELTASRFIDMPAELAVGMRPRGYLSGDWARWTAEHEIDFLGRVDHQLKVQGYRVELDEVRVRIAAYPGVSEVEVLPGERGEEGCKSLDAAFCAGVAIDIGALRRYLGEHLPPYMVPARLVQLAHLPLTLQGKVDKAALAAHLTAPTAKPLDDARHEVDRRIAGLWRDMLRVEHVGIDDHFASLGGHSMLLLDLAGQLFTTFGVELQLGDMVRRPTLRQLSDLVVERMAERQMQVADALSAPGAEAGSGMEAAAAAFPLLPTQLAMFLGQQRAPTATTYHIPVLLRLEGRVDAAALGKAWQCTLAAHEALRVRFELVGDSVVQRSQGATGHPLQVREIRADMLEDCVAQAMARPFDLSQADCARAHLFVAEREAWLLVVCHHIVVDGIGLGRLLDELARRYAGAHLEQTERGSFAWRDELRRSLDDLAAAQPDVDYFAERLRGAPARVELRRLPAGVSRGDAALASIVTRTVPSALRAALATYCRARAITPALPLLAAFALGLSRYGAGSDLRIGMPVSGRRRASAARTIGMFVNSLGLRLNWDERICFDQLVASTAAEQHAALAHERAPLNLVSDALGVAADAVYNVLFNIQPLSLASLDFGAEVAASTVALPWNAAKYDVALQVEEGGDGVCAISLEYRNSVLLPEEAESFLERYLALLAQGLDQPDAALPDLFQQSERGASAIIAAPASAQNAATLWDRIAEHARVRPEAPALGDAEGELSWEALVDRANGLAARLAAVGVTRGDVVALCLPRSACTVIAMLACWRIGAAFLSLDQEWQAERLRHCCDAANAKAAIVDDAALRLADVVHIAMDDAHSAPGDFSCAAPQLDDVAYVIFTSGSTGQPKGVPITHANLANYAAWFSRFGRLSPADRAAVLTSLCFDLSFTSVWPLLWIGGSVHIAPAMPAVDASAVVDFIAARAISCLKATPSLLSVMLPDFEAQAARLPALRLVALGGEPPRRAELLRLHQALRGVELINHYGPTETTIGCAALRLDKATLQANAGPVPVGSAIDNACAVIVDALRRPLPQGLVGELCIGGAGVSPGYLRAEPLQKQRFFHAPTLGDGLFYATGDAAWVDAQGRIVLQGRIDRQVKIRGYRIELAEVEHLVGRIDGVTGAAALAVSNPQGDAELCLFWQGPLTEAAVLRRQLAQTLPSFMLPSHLRHVDALPVTGNGKVDHGALLAGFAPAERPHGAPSGQGFKGGALLVELHALWLELTGLAIDEPDTPLFDAGGHSLQMLRLFAELKQRFGEVLTLPELFGAATLAEIATLLGRRLRPALPPADAGFTASTRMVDRFARRHRAGLDAVLVSVVASAIYEHAESDFVELTLRKDGEDRGLAFDFSRYDALEHLLRDTVAQLAQPALAPSTQAWRLYLDDEPELQDSGVVLSLRVAADGVTGQAWAGADGADALAAVVSRIAELLNQIQ